MIVLPIYSIKETKTNNCLSALTKHDRHQLWEGGMPLHWSNSNRLHTVYVVHLWNWLRTVKERTSEGQLKQAVYVSLVKIHSGALNHWDHLKLHRMELQITIDRSRLCSQIRSKWSSEKLQQKYFFQEKAYVSEPSITERYLNIG